MGSSIRDRIVDAADQLFYQQGYEHTSFADIAGAVQISRGNFYYHFRTKDEILDAVIDARLARTREMLAGWEAGGTTPAERIRLFIEILIRNQTKIMRYGCPVGTLCTELAKLGHGAQDRAGEVFTLFREWLRGQFAQMGCGEDADAFAMHLLGRSQGVATLASAFRDDVYVRHEVEQMCAWMQSCGPARSRAR